MSINAAEVKTLRDKTGAGMMDCKTALTEAGGDFEQAVDILRKKGVAVAAKRSGRATTEGQIGAYVHAGGKIAVMVEVNSETDFVAKTDDFAELAKNLAMHIAASSPICVDVDDLPADLVDREKAIYRQQALDEGKPEKIVDKIVDGRLKKFQGEVCLLAQPYVKDTDLSVAQYIQEVMGRLGENIQVRRFIRYQVGEDIE
ncbi:MAG: translation elongation factor Ts [Proteobacteria bacterium]|nr:translation elongation factor Ts [Pseudomonadota bacterium]MBU1740355.1 translation elongation factor Ts [Pseudomonadota bacterium]